MKIIFYKNFSEDAMVQKQIAEPIQIEGSIRDEAVSIMRPVITVKADLRLFNYNYAYIPDFNRYYFFSEPPIIDRTGIYTINLSEDVLMSLKGDENNGYADGFLSNVGYVMTSMRYGNFYLKDDNLPIQQNTKLTTRKRFSCVFSASSSGTSPASIVMNVTNCGTAAAIPEGDTNGTT